MFGIGNPSKTKNASRVYPQRGVLSPLLWTLVIDELLNPSKTILMPFTNRRKLYLKTLVLDGDTWGSG